MVRLYHNSDCWLEYKIGCNLWRSLVVPIANYAAHVVQIKISIPVN